MKQLIKDAFFGSILIFIMLNLSSCGSNLEVVRYTPKETIIEKDLDAIYHFELGGIIEVNQDGHDWVSITMPDYLTSINKQNGTYGEHPKTTINDQYLSNNLLYYSVNVNYGTGDLEDDTTGANITGTKRTDFIFHFLKDELIVSINIFDNAKNQNVNKIIANRMLTGKK